MRILAISGSLRLASSNTTLLRAASRVAPENVVVTIYTGLGDLPPFNPDLDGEGKVAPPSVTNFRRQLQASDGVLISSPEYAHGVPGVLKNALDWTVSSGEFMEKPVAFLNANPHATYAQSSLIETLTVMMASIITEASITLPIQSKKLDEASRLADSEASSLLHSAIVAFAHAINNNQVLDAPRDFAR